MNNLSLKQKIIGLIALIGTILILIFQRGIYSKEASPTPQPVVKTQSEQIEITSTNPSPLNEATIPDAKKIELTFNYPVQNPDEFRVKFDPKTDIKIELSSDRKTAKIIFNKPLQLGTGYTLFILPETKFDSKGNLGREIIYHFRTINYNGI